MKKPAISLLGFLLAKSAENTNNSLARNLESINMTPHFLQMSSMMHQTDNTSDYQKLPY